MNREEQQWPLPNPRALPPSNPTPSQVGDGIGGLGGSDRAWEPSHGTSAGGRDRTREFSHGRHVAFICQGTLHPLPTPGFLPPSKPNPSKVGEGLIIPGYRGSRGASAAYGRGGGGGGTCALPGVSTLSFDRCFEHCCRSGPKLDIPSSTMNSTAIQESHLYPNISYPNQVLRTAFVCYCSLHIFYFS